MRICHRLSALRDRISHMQSELSKGHIDHAQYIASLIDRDIEDWYLDSLRINHDNRQKYRLPNGHCFSDFLQLEVRK